MKKKTFVIALCLALVVAFAAGGAIAWLTDTTDSVTNTFTVGNVKLDLYEHNADGEEVKQLSFKMIPGTTATKDPTVEVQKGSEECYVFVRVTETNNDLSNNRGKLVIYEIADGWVALPGVDGVYYYNTTVTPTDADVTLQVLKGDNGGTITFNGEITQDDMDAITAAPTTAPTLTFTAYAVQAAGSSTAVDAWAKIFPAS